MPPRSKKKTTRKKGETRGRKPKANPLDKLISVYVDADEYERISALAEAEHLSRSAWCARAARRELAREAEAESSG